MADDNQEHWEQIGNRLARARERAGLSLEEAAAKISVDAQQLAKWEACCADMLWSKFAKLAAAYHVSTSCLITGEGPNEPQVKWSRTCECGGCGCDERGGR